MTPTDVKALKMEHWGLQNYIAWLALHIEHSLPDDDNETATGILNYLKLPLSPAIQKEPQRASFGKP